MRIAVTVLVLLHAALSWCYTVVTRDGRKLQAEAPPTYAGGKAVVVLPGGLKVELAEAEVDRPATEKANQAPAEAKAFTNEDLAKAKGLSSMEGDVKAEGMDTVMVESRTAASSGRDVAGRGDEPPGTTAAGRRVAELQKELDDVMGKIRANCREWGYANPQNRCDPSWYERQKELMADLQEATKERDAEVTQEHEERVERYGHRMDKEERSQTVATLERQVEALRASLAKAEEKLRRTGSNVADVNEKLQAAAALTRAEKELAAARGE